MLHKEQLISGKEILSKRGSITVYALVFLTTMISLISFYISASKNELVKTGSYVLGDLWAESILGEYDTELYDKYGIFAYYGDEGLVGQKLQFLIDYTFKHKHYASCNVENVKIYDFSLAKTENLLKQIREIMTLETASGLIMGENDSALVRYDDGTGSSGSPRAIFNQSTLNSLPSAGRTNDGLLDRAGEFLKSFTSVRDIIKTGTDEYFINKYIQSKFRNTYYAKEGNYGFLFGEQEYIVAGKTSDEQNRKAVRNRIIAMREVMNVMYIESNPEMQEMILAAAAVITAGYAPEEAAAVITGAWALAESVNDYELLIRGKPVPVMKTEESWAVSLENVINNINDGCIDTGNRTGDDYNDYIVYMLCLLDDKTKLLRIMDLIQINMRYNYRSDFLIQEHYVGVNYQMNANGEVYEFEAEYQE